MERGEGAVRGERGALGEGARTFYLRDDGPSHCLALAPTRSGKGVGLVLPTLLGGWMESAIIHDMKGENYAQTAAWRREMLGHRVLRFDPTAAEASRTSLWAMPP